MSSRLFFFFAFYVSTYTTFTHADILNAAVASNFTHTMRLLASDFQKTSGHTVKISSASTGKLYTQIIYGAPFDMFFAADEARANLLIKAGKAHVEMSHIYAQGKLVLISNIKPMNQCTDILHASKIRYLAIANPKIAPYGAATQQVLQKLNKWASLKNKLVLGENIAQTLQFIATGNASAGFVAKSMLNTLPQTNYACKWDVPVNMHSPINQKMVVLSKSENKPAVRAFWQYIQSKSALNIIKNNGYNTL